MNFISGIAPRRTGEIIFLIPVIDVEFLSLSESVLFFPIKSADFTVGSVCWNFLVLLILDDEYGVLTFFSRLTVDALFAPLLSRGSFAESIVA